MTLAEVIQRTVQDAAKRHGDAQDFMERLADKLNRSVPWLYNALNPNDEKHKISLPELLVIMETCEDYSALEHMAARCGFMLAPTCEIRPDGQDMNEECMQSVHACNAFWEASRNKKRHYTEDEPLLREAKRELEECWVRKRSEQSRSSVPVVGSAAARQ